MKRKELKKIAEEIAKNELIIQNSGDERAIENAKNEILTISKKISFMDLDIIDEMVMEILGAQ